MKTNRGAKLLLLCVSCFVVFVDGAANSHETESSAPATYKCQKCMKPIPDPVTPSCDSQGEGGLDSNEEDATTLFTMCDRCKADDERQPPPKRSCPDQEASEDSEASLLEKNLLGLDKRQRLKRIHDLHPPGSVGFLDDNVGFSAPYLIIFDDDFNDSSGVQKRKRVLKAFKPRGLSSDLDTEASESLKRVLTKVNAEVKASLVPSARCIFADTEYTENRDRLTITQLGLEKWYETKLKCDPDRKLMYSEQDFGGEDIYSLIERSKNKNIPIPRKEIAKLFLGMVTIFKSMSDKRHVHRDACMGNILRGPSLIDFGSYTTAGVKNVFDRDGTKQCSLLPYVAHLLDSRNPNRAPKCHSWPVNKCKVTKNTLYAVDLWCTVVMLFSLITKVDLVFEREYRAIESRVECFTQGGILKCEPENLKVPEQYGKFIPEDHKNVLTNVVLPLIQRLGQYDKKPEDVVKIYSDILEGDLGAPLRKWLAEDDSEIERFEAALTRRRLSQRLQKQRSKTYGY